MIDFLSSHGLGILCVVAILFCFCQIVSLLRSQRKNMVMLSLLVGVTTGVIGFCGGAFVVMILEDAMMFDPRGSSYFLIRTSLCVIFFCITTFLVSSSMRSVFKDPKHARATTYTAFLVPAFVVLVPIAYRWVAN